MTTRSDEWISTTEAARRTGLSDRTIRTAAESRQLAARRNGPAWLVDAAALDAFRSSRKSFAGRTRKQHPLTPTGHRSLALLREWGSGTAEELALVLEVNVGNVRKGLAIAEKLHMAVRDGSDWSLTESGRQWLVEHSEGVAA